MWAMKCRSWNVCVCVFNERVFALSARAKAIADVRSFHSCTLSSCSGPHFTNVWLSGKNHFLRWKWCHPMWTPGICPKCTLRLFPLKLLGNIWREGMGAWMSQVVYHLHGTMRWYLIPHLYFLTLWVNSHCCLLSKEGWKNISLLTFESVSPEPCACLHMFPVYSIFTVYALY